MGETRPGSSSLKKCQMRENYAPAVRRENHNEDITRFSFVLCTKQFE